LIYSNLAIGVVHYSYIRKRSTFPRQNYPPAELNLAGKSDQQLKRRRIFPFIKVNILKTIQYCFLSAFNFLLLFHATNSFQHLLNAVKTLKI